VNGFHRLKQIAVIERVHQVGDHLGVGLAVEHVAALLECRAQFVVVLDDAVVHQRHTTRTLRRIGPRAMAEVRVRVVHRRCAVRGPARVRNADEAFQRRLGHLLGQFGHTRGAARTLQATVGMHSHAAGVITAVFQPLQALHQNRNDVAIGNGADDATHAGYLLKWMADGRAPNEKYLIDFCRFLNLNFKHYVD